MVARARHEHEEREACHERREQGELATPRLQARARTGDARADHASSVGEREWPKAVGIVCTPLGGLDLQRRAHRRAEPEIAIEQACGGGGARAMREADGERQCGGECSGGASQAPAPLRPLASATICSGQATATATSAPRRTRAIRRRRSSRRCQRRRPRATVWTSTRGRSGARSMRVTSRASAAIQRTTAGALGDRRR